MLAGQCKLLPWHLGVSHRPRVAISQADAHAVNCEAIRWQYINGTYLLPMWTRIDVAIRHNLKRTAEQTARPVKLTGNAPAASDLMLPRRQLCQTVIHLLLGSLLLSRVVLPGHVGTDQVVHEDPIHDQQGVLLLKYPIACSLDIGHGPRGSLTRL